MSLPEDYPALFRSSDLSDTRSDLDMLRAKLPTDAVASLAREVLTRVSKQSQPVEQSQTSIETLTQALIAADDSDITALVDRYHRTGTDIHTLYLSYLAPAAHLLGEWWTKDIVSLTDVSIGTGRIYALMRGFKNRLPPPVRPSGKAAFFVSVPGETHTLGVKMAADLYRQEGWRIDVEIGVPHDQLVDQIVASEHLLIGISAGGIHALPDLARLVLALRVSKPHALILVSGNIVAEAADSIRLIHVDRMSSTYEGANRYLKELWQQLAELEDS